MATDPKPRFTVEQYLEFEAQNAEGPRYEFEDGYLYPVDASAPGAQAASPSHGIISGNLFRLIGNGLQAAANGCRAFTKDIQVKAGTRWAYPDVVVACAPEFDRSNCLLNPILIGEVLSPKTEDFDRGGKFERYRTLPSFGEYLIAYQDRMKIEHHIRQSNGDWVMRTHLDPLAPVGLVSIDVALLLPEVYDGVLWPG